MQEEDWEEMVQQVTDEIQWQVRAAGRTLNELRKDEFEAALRQNTEQLAQFIHERIVQRVTRTEADAERLGRLAFLQQEHPEEVQMTVRVFLRKLLEGTVQLPVKRAVELMVRKRFGM